MSTLARFGIAYLVFGLLITVISIVANEVNDRRYSPFLFLVYIPLWFPVIAYSIWQEARHWKS